MNRLTAGLIGVIVGLCLASGVYLFMKYRPGEQAVPAPVAKELQGAATVTKECQRVVTYPGREKALGVPVAPGREIAAATQLPASRYPHTVIATHTEGSGAIDLLTRRDTLPWFGLERHSAVGIAYGLRDGVSAPVIRLDGRLEVLQAKALTGELLGNVDTSGGYFVGMRVEYWLP